MNNIETLNRISALESKASSLENWLKAAVLAAAILGGLGIQLRLDLSAVGDDASEATLAATAAKSLAERAELTIGEEKDALNLQFEAHSKALEIVADEQTLEVSASIDAALKSAVNDSVARAIREFRESVSQQKFLLAALLPGDVPDKYYLNMNREEANPILAKDQARATTFEFELTE